MRNLTVNRLIKEGVPVNKSLPSIIIKKVCTSKDVGVRINILGVFLAISEDPKSIKFFKKFLKEQGMFGFLTTTEKLILESEK